MEKEHLTVTIHTPFIKLDALLKFAGLCDTGGFAKDWCSRALYQSMAAFAPCGARKSTPTMSSLLTTLKYR